MLVVGFADLLAQLLVASGESTQRGLGGLRRGRRAGRPGRNRAQLAMILCSGQVTQLLAQLGWAGDDQRLDLVGGLTTGFDRAGAGHAERPDRLDAAIPQLRHPRRRPRQDRFGGGVGVEGVGLAVRPAGLAVGAVDLHHGEPDRAQIAGQPGTVGAGALHADRLECAVLAEPCR